MDDIIFNVYLYLPLKEIYQCMQVNKQCYEYSLVPYLWFHLLEKDYKDEYNEFEQNTLYETYKLCSELDTIRYMSYYSVKNISELNNLRRLYFAHSQLKTIPSAIGNLTNLQGLYLNDNQLTTIPETIGQLSNLISLSLENNQLKNIPDTIGNLSELKFLYLNNNNLTTIPESMGKLNKLIGLHLRNNQIKIIPEAIKRLNIKDMYYD